MSSSCFLFTTTRLELDWKPACLSTMTKVGALRHRHSVSNSLLRILRSRTSPKNSDEQRPHANYEDRGGERWSKSHGPGSEGRFKGLEGLGLGLRIKKASGVIGVLGLSVGLLGSWVFVPRFGMTLRTEVYCLKPLRQVVPTMHKTAAVWAWGVFTTNHI